MKSNFQSIGKFSLVIPAAILMPMLSSNSAHAQFATPNFEFFSQSNRFFQEGNRQLEREIKIINSDSESIETQLQPNGEREQEIGQSDSLLPSSNSITSDRKSN